MRLSWWKDCISSIIRHPTSLCKWLWTQYGRRAAFYDSNVDVVHPFEGAEGG